MRIVALEEHFIVPSLIQQSGLASAHGAAMKPEIREALADLDETRIRAMDEGQITRQVLSAAAPGTDLLEGQAGIDFAKKINDSLAVEVSRHPGRYAGFAHLPKRSEKAADELERAVLSLDFRGAFVNETTEGLFLDHEKSRRSWLVRKN